jgi:phosphohistidine phosphatase
MQIFLLRHGSAGPAPRGLPDCERVLTAEGNKQVQNVVRRAARLIPPATILSSPFKRALQTAEIVSRELNAATQIFTSGALVPESSPEEAWREILVYRQSGALILVGHEPLFSALIAYILGCKDMAVEMSTATMVSIEVPNPGLQPTGILRWVLTAHLAAD